MKTINLEINDKEYNVLVAQTEDEKATGLMNVEEMSDSEGMLFVYDYPHKAEFWMYGTSIALDVIFINSDWEVISVKKGMPYDETILSEDNVQYVLELNQNSGVKPGDEIDIEDDELSPGSNLDLNKMYVYGSDGEVQAILQGSERIFSIRNTKTLIRMAKRAYTTKKESDYKRLGKKLFEYLSIQDSNTPEYIETKKESE